MAIASGYRPTRDQMSAIVAAARAFYRFASRWRRHSKLPGYPVERGNLAALVALFRLERALNPDRLAWGRSPRPGQSSRDWPEEAAEGLAWVDNLLRMIIDQHGCGSMGVAPDFPSWARSIPHLPETVAIREEELQSLREAIRLLPRPASLPEPGPVGQPAGPPRDRDEATSATAAVPDPGVILFGPRIRPIVLGRPKELLGAVQYRVVKALLDSGDAGLSKAKLEAASGSGDAVGVLKRLARSDRDWGTVIFLPGRPGGLGYRFLRPIAQESPPEGHRNPQTDASSAHTLAQTIGSARKIECEDLRPAVGLLLAIDRTKAEDTS